MADARGWLGSSLCFKADSGFGPVELGISTEDAVRVPDADEPRLSRCRCQQWQLSTDCRSRM